MPSIEELKSLIVEFRKQGVSDEEIRKVLQEMNVDVGTIEELISGGEGKTEEGGEGAVPEDEIKERGKLPEPNEVPVPPLPEEPPEGPVEVTRELPQMETVEHVRELQRRVDELHRKVPSVDDIVEIRERLASIEGSIREIREEMKAVQKLLREILNTERSILVDLYEEAKECKK